MKVAVEIEDEQLNRIVVDELNAMIEMYYDALAKIELDVSVNMYHYGNTDEDRSIDKKRIKKQLKSYKLVLSDFVA